MAHVTATTIRNRLRTVIDPELHVNIIDLGLVYRVKVRKVGKVWKVWILMTLTTPGCPLAGMFDALVRHSLKNIPGIDPPKDVEIELTFDPPWVPEMMEKKTRITLGLA